MNASQMREFVQTWFNEIWGKGHLDLIDTMTVDPFLRHSRGGSIWVGHEQAKLDLAQYMRVLNRPVTVINDQAIASDTIWTRATSTGVNLDTGDRSVVTWLLTMRFSDHLLAETWSIALNGVEWTT